MTGPVRRDMLKFSDVIATTDGRSAVGASRGVSDIRIGWLADEITPVTNENSASTGGVGPARIHMPANSPESVPARA